jgi:hypothetical protein
MAEENTSLFDYVHDDNFCLVVCLPVCFFDMLTFKNFILFFLIKPAAAMKEAQKTADKLGIDAHQGY